MTRRLVLAGALAAAACTPTHPHHGGELIHLHAAPVSTSTSSSTSVTEALARPPVQTRASRNARRRTPATTGPLPAAGDNTGIRVTSTSYCETGRTANGQHPYAGSAAANRWPFGTRLHIVELGRDVTINDRIGHGSDLDIAYPGDCAGAIRYGRRIVTVQVVAA